MPSTNGTNFFGYPGAVGVALTDPFGNAVLVRCTVANIPSAVAGYAIGCILQGTDTGGIYTNTGTALSATFTLLEDAGGSFTLPVSATDATTTTTTSFALAQNAVTSGIGLSQALNGLTTGQGHLISHTTAVIADTGSLLRVTSSSIDTGGATNGTVFDFKSTGQLAGTMGRVDSIMTTGTVMSIISTGVMTTTGNLLTLTANSATTAAGLLRINANGLTDGIGAIIASSATAMTSTGRLFKVSHTGATSVSGILTEFASAANDETVIVQITASDVNALGTGLNISTATTTGNGAVITANALTTGLGLSIASSATAITGAGRLLYVNHTGTTSTSGTIAEIASAANDETIVAKITANSLSIGVALEIDINGLTSGQGLMISSSSSSIGTSGRMFLVSHAAASGTNAVLSEFISSATDETTVLSVKASDALAAGKVLDISGFSVTTGTLLNISDNTAHTTGTAVNIITNSANTGTRTLLNVKQDHASATGTTVAAFTQDAPTSTNFFKVLALNGNNFWVGNGTTSPNTVLTGTAGDIAINCDTNKAYYCTGTTNWTALA